MPIAPAAQAALILTPIFVAAGVSLYEAHKEEIHEFVRDRLSDLREIAEDLGIRERRRERAYGHDNTSHRDDEDEVSAVALDRFLRRRRSVESWLSSRGTTTAIDGQERDLRRRNLASIAKEEEDVKTTQTDTGDVSREGTASTFDIKREESPQIKTEELDDVEALRNVEEATAIKTEASTPKTLVGIHTPTSDDDNDEDPFQLLSDVHTPTSVDTYNHSDDEHDAQSVASAGYLLSRSLEDEVQSVADSDVGGVHTPTSEEADEPREESQAYFTSRSLDSSWSNLSRRS